MSAKGARTCADGKHVALIGARRCVCGQYGLEPPPTFQPLVWGRAPAVSEQRTGVGETVDELIQQAFAHRHLNDEEMAAVRELARAASRGADATSERGELRDALVGLLDHYVRLVESGDAGHWNAEEEPVVIAARRALASQGGER